MVKRREPQATVLPTNDQIEVFAAGADGGAENTRPAINTNAIRDFKAIRVPFNEYEYNLLEDVAKKTGRTKLNVIRWAILKLHEST